MKKKAKQMLDNLLGKTEDNFSVKAYKIVNDLFKSARRRGYFDYDDRKRDPYNPSQRTLKERRRIIEQKKRLRGFVYDNKPIPGTRGESGSPVIYPQRGENPEYLTEPHVAALRHIAYIHELAERHAKYHRGEDGSKHLFPGGPRGRYSPENFEEQGGVPGCKICEEHHEELRKFRDKAGTMETSSEPGIYQKQLEELYGPPVIKKPKVSEPSEVSKPSEASGEINNTAYKLINDLLNKTAKKKFIKNS